MENVVVWFELPVKKIDRAITFYSKVFGYKFETMEAGPNKMAMFPHEEGTVGGALVQSPESEPASVGTMLYLNGGKDLSKPLSKVKAAGGKIIQDKLEIGDHGFMAIFEDTEGNHVALHSEN